MTIAQAWEIASFTLRVPGSRLRSATMEMLMWWKIVSAFVCAALGYWAWFDRRFYGFGLLGSALWAIGVALGTYSGFVGSIAAISWIAQRI